MFKLHSKERIGGKVKKVYDQPQTPYQRLVTGGNIEEVPTYNLKKKMKTLNLIEIKREMDKKLKEFWETAEKHRVRMKYLSNPSNS